MCELTNQSRLQGALEETGAKTERYRQRGAAGGAVCEDFHGKHPK